MYVSQPPEGELEVQAVAPGASPTDPSEALKWGEGCGVRGERGQWEGKTTSVGLPTIKINE